jgi:hypothetical protein
MMAGLRAGAGMALLLVASGLLAGCKDDEPGAPSGGGGATAGTAIRVASSRADLISGSTALVEVALPTGADAGQLRVRAAGRDQSSTFARRSDGRVLGLVSGLAAGPSVIEATAANGSFAGAQLTVTARGVNAPVLLQSHVSPYVCATPQGAAATADNPGSNASGLSTAPTDAQCTTAAETQLWYRTTVAAGTGGCSFVVPDATAAVPANSCFQRYVPGTTAAAQVATATPLGSTTAVPYIVRVERGVINRGIYEVAVLFDPTRPWTWDAPQPQWNRKVIHNYGGGTGQPRLQSRPNTSWVVDTQLSRGFMVVVNSLTDSANNSNRVLVTETSLKMKEHVIKTYGEIRYYAGNGGSGGAINQHVTASIHPGILDGLQIQLDFADSVTTGIEVADCVQLVNFYAGTTWTNLMQSQGLSQAQINAKKAAINGHLDQQGCQNWTNAFGNVNKPGNYRPVFVINPVTGALFTQPTLTNNCRLPAAQVYDPASNPNGVRCTDPDAAQMVWGTVAGTNRAPSTNDNVGVQYGLKALLSGAITAEEFVTLNEGVGGSDADSNIVARRSTADADALRIAYRSGIVVSGTNIARVPIIDQRQPDETVIHYNWRSFSERERLLRDAGSFANQVIWRTVNPVAAGLPAQSLLTLDTWLTALNGSAPKPRVNAARTQAQVIAGKPATAFDFCYLSTDTGFTTPVRDFAVCDQDPPLVYRSSPRQVAGGPRVEDILKCQLRPFTLADYPGISFTPAQVTRLQATFSTGVCDWTKPGVNQVATEAPLTFAAGPGGVALPPEPVSTTI